MKVMSFNAQHCMNYVTQKIDFDVMEDAIRRCGAEVVGLNEMRNLGVDVQEYQNQAGILAARLGYYAAFAKAIDFEGLNPYGNAIISKYPILSAETILVPDPFPRLYDGYYETRCLLKAKLDVPGGLTVCVIHFGLNPDEAENAVQTVLDNLEDTRCVLMGDFNLEPDSPLLLPIRGALFDTAACFSQPLHSFPSDAPDRKIDYIFTSRDISVQAADIPAIVASDHRPHTAELKL